MFDRETASPERINSITALPMLARAISSTAARFSRSSFVGIFTISFSRWLAGTANGRRHPAQTQGETRGRGGNLFRLWTHLDDGLAGDVLGAFALFAIVIVVASFSLVAP